MTEKSSNCQKLHLGDVLVNNLGLIKIVLIYGSNILEHIQAKFRNIREIKQLFHIEKTD